MTLPFKQFERKWAFRALIRVVAFQLIFLTGVFVAARFVMFEAYGGPAADEASFQELLFTWLLGLRYDFRIALTLLSPLILVGFLAISFKKTGRGFRIFLAAWSVFMALAAVLSSAGNYYYFQTFQHCLDAGIFAFFEDDKAAILNVVWKEYPALAIIILTATAAIFSASVSLHLWSGQNSPDVPAGFLRSLGRGAGYLILGVAIIFSLLHPSTLLLGWHQPQFTDRAVLAALVPNGLQALKQAWRQKKLFYHLQAVSRQEGEELWRAAGLDSGPATTDKNPWMEQNQPHVVAVMLESLAANFLALDDEKRNDLLGDLRPHFQSDFVFQRFISANNDTALSFNAVFFQSPTTVINQSHLNKKAILATLGDTPILAYKKAGYKVVFIYPGSAMWYNLSTFMPAQGVDECYFANSLLEKYQVAKQQAEDWGLPDEFAYRLAEELINDADQPLFIIILTVTNHPPYNENDLFSQTLPIDPESLTGRVSTGREVNINQLRAFQYASDAFGKFISNIKAGPAAHRTIIAGTGDHRVRRVRSKLPEDLALQVAVPFYLYVPDEIRRHCPWAYEPMRPGSHKDIMPTLYAFSLSEAGYQALGGRNLLAVNDDPARRFGYNTRLWIDEHGAYTRAIACRFSTSGARRKGSSWPMRRLKWTPGKKAGRPPMKNSGGGRPWPGSKALKIRDIWRPANESVTLATLCLADLNFRA